MTCRPVRSRPFAVSLLVLSLTLVPPGARAADPPLAQHPEVADALAVLDAWIKATVADRELPGLSIGIVHDQTLVWAKGYGFADVERKVPATSATAYRIASK